MKNYLLIGTGFVVVLIVLVAVLHYEGEQTRRAIRESPAGAVSDGLNKIDQVAAPQAVNDALGKIQGILNPNAESGSPKPPTLKNLPDLAAPAMETTQKAVSQMQDLVGDVLGAGNRSGKESGSADGAGRPKSGNIFDQMRNTVEDVTGGAVPVPGNKREPPTVKSDQPKSNPEAKQDRPATEKSSSRTTTNGVEANEAREAVRTPGPENIVDGLFNAARRTVETSDKFGQKIFGMSVDDERRWGKQLHEQVIGDMKVVRDPALNRRVQQAAVPFLKRLQRPEIEYTFTVLQSDEDDLNAFSLPGGYVYIHSALINFIQNDEELQFVLGHEIGHVDLGHCAQKLSYGGRVADLSTPALGQMFGVLHNLLSRSYTQDQEYESDRYGFIGAIAAGQTREQALSFPRRFGKHTEKSSAKPADENENRGIIKAVVERSQNHFHTHPPMAERLRRLEAIDVATIKS